MINSVDPSVEVLLEHMAKIDASDLYLTAGSPAVFRVDGVGHAARQALDPVQLEKMADSIMTPAQREEFRTRLEMNLALSLGERGRFRVNVFRQRGAVGLVIRQIRTRIKSVADLALPPVLGDVALSKRGLVLVVGGTGSGKSTTLAAMVDHRNARESGHILTVEDPIEFIHGHKRCVVTQREVGIDTHSYAEALRSALRQAPDVVLIGEIRDAETMEAGIAFAETGHLCLSTLHSNNANQALERVMNFFPPGRQAEIRMQLSLNLRGIVSQRLVPSSAGGRAAALEIMLDTPRIRDLIKRGETDALKDAMDQGSGEGCRTFDAALFDLCIAGRISIEEALRAADSANNLRLRLERFRAFGTEDPNEIPLRLQSDPRASHPGGAPPVRRDAQAAGRSLGARPQAGPVAAGPAPRVTTPGMPAAGRPPSTG